MNKKLRISTSLLTLLLTAFFFNLSSQIIYTDINPDTVLVASSSPWHYYYMDINQDNVVDFKLAHFSPSASWVNAEIYCQSGNNQDEAILTSGTTPQTLTSGASIGASSGTWINTVSGSTNSALFVPAGTTDKYLGLRVQINSQWYYGWARVDVPANTSNFTIKSFAFNTVAGQAILAGDTGAATFSSSEEPEKFNIYQLSGNLVINLNNDKFIGGHFAIYNLTGQLVNSGKLNNKHMEISTTAFTNGIYVVTLKQNDKAVSRKIFVR